MSIGHIFLNSAPWEQYLTSPSRERQVMTEKIRKALQSASHGLPLRDAQGLSKEVDENPVKTHEKPAAAHEKAHENTEMKYMGN